LLNSRNTFIQRSKKAHSEFILRVNKMIELAHAFSVFEMIRTLEGERTMAKVMKKTTARKAKKPAARKTAAARKPAARKTAARKTTARKPARKVAKKRKAA
jgi:hypothetical protein